MKLKICREDDIVRIIKGFRITIPKKARKELGLKEGMYLIAEVKDKVLMIYPAKIGRLK